MTQNKILNQLFRADGGPYSLSSAMSARSGSGKTTLLSTLITQATKLPEFKDQRFIYASLKHENPFKDAPVVRDSSTLMKKLKKQQIVVFYPLIPENYENEIDDLIETIFVIAGNNPEIGFHITIDDSNILKGFSSSGHPSGSVKKLAIAGRSKGIRALFVTHKLGFLPRLLNGNISNLIIMSMSGSDSEYARKVFGMDFEGLISELGGFRWSVVDLLEDKIHRFDPISI